MFYCELQTISEDKTLLLVMRKNCLYKILSVNFEVSSWCLQFSQKTNKNNSTWGTIVVKLDFFVRFFGRIEDTKKHISELTDI